MPAKYKVKDHFLLKSIADEHIVIARGPFAIEFSGVLVLNESGATLWKCLESYCSINDLCAELIRVFDVDKQTAMQDVSSYIAKMEDYGLLDIQQ